MQRAAATLDPDRRELSSHYVASLSLRRLNVPQAAVRRSHHRGRSARLEAAARLPPRETPAVAHRRNRASPGAIDSRGCCLMKLASWPDSSHGRGYSLDRDHS
jgi:hypothetical protein